jgi:hypothetical protein
MQNLILYRFIPSLNKQLTNLENKSILNCLLKLIVIRKKFQASYPWRECAILVHLFLSECTQLCHHVCLVLSSLALFWEVQNSILCWVMYSVFSSLLEMHCINFERYGKNLIHAWLKWNGKTVSKIWFYDNNGYIMTESTFFYFCVPSYFIYV